MCQSNILISNCIYLTKDEPRYQDQEGKQAMKLDQVVTQVPPTNHLHTCTRSLAHMRGCHSGTWERGASSRGCPGRCWAGPWHVCSLSDLCRFGSTLKRVWEWNRNKLLVKFTCYMMSYLSTLTLFRSGEYKNCTRLRKKNFWSKNQKLFLVSKFCF